MMKNTGIGFLLALQFFSAFPVKKQLPMKKMQLTVMYSILPVLGLLFGGVIASATLLFREYTDTGSLLVAFIAVAGSFALTGGLHMDGMADVGDAYFSYQDKERRLAIMGDPRIGAFGAIVLILAIAGKIIIVSETILSVSLWALVFIPIVSRIGLMLLFSLTDSAKDSGLAAYFQKSADLNKIAFAAAAWLAVTMGAMVFLLGWGLSAALLLTFLAASFIYRNWCRKNFGGVTGDLFGAYVEGMELLLWTMLLFFI